MREAVNFLRTVYSESVYDVANIITSEAEEDKESILRYLIAVKEYTEGLIDKVKNYEGE